MKIVAENSRKKVIILGGLGFIGRNLYNSLKNEDYDVTILTEHIYENDQDLLKSDIYKNIVVGSILDKDFIEKVLIGYDVIFSFAGSSGASDSIKNPYHDLDANLKGHLNILEACKKNNPNALLLFPSTRLVYGKPEINPVNEKHPTRPESIYAIHKLTTENYYLLYQRLYNLNCIIYRVSNPFGSYQRFGSNNYGILNWFIHNALSKKEIQIYGEGNQKRDFIYIDDLTNLFKMSMNNPTMHGKIYNVGYGEGIAIKDVAKIIEENIPGAKSLFKPWPAIDKMIETGDYVSDISLLTQETGWRPSISFKEGIKKTIDFYAKESK